MAIEKRLIDASDLGSFSFHIECEEEGEVFERCVVDWEDIETAPTVDAVEVVRCKDCKHYDNSEGIQWCHLNSKFYPGGVDWHSFPDDGFCSYGERRTDA